MACVWVLQAFIILFLYTDLHKLKKMEIAINKSSDNIVSSSPRATINAAHRPIYTGRSVRVTYDDDVHSHPSQCLERNLSYKADNLMERAESYIVKCPVMHSTNIAGTDSETYYNPASTLEQPTSSSSLSTVAAIISTTTTVDTYAERNSFDNEDEFEKLSGEYMVNDTSFERTIRKDSQGSQDYIQSTEETLADYLHGRSRCRFFYQGN